MNRYHLRTYKPDSRPQFFNKIITVLQERGYRKGRIYYFLECRRVLCSYFGISSEYLHTLYHEMEQDGLIIIHNYKGIEIVHNGRSALSEKREVEAEA